MHGGILFSLFFLLGLVVGVGACIGILAVLGNFNAGSGVYTTASLLISFLCFMGGVVAAAWTRNWMLSGVLVGMCVPVAFMSLLAAACGGAR